MMDLDPEARRIVDLARQARTPSAADKARVERRFALALGITAGAASAAASAQAASSVGAGKSAASVLALKWWGAGGGAVLAAALATYAALPSAQAPAAPAAVARAEAAPRAPVAEAAAAPLDVEPEPARAPAEHAGPERAPRPNRVRHAGAALASELELLHGAQQAWRAREASRALSLVEQHRSRYPHSTLRAERDALHVLALCELGRKADATRIARALLAREPRSPLRASIEQSCALK